MPRAGPRCSSATPLPPPSSPQTCRCGMGNPSWLSPYPVLTIEFWMVELELLLARNHEPSWEVPHLRPLRLIFSSEAEQNVQDREADGTAA